MKSTIFEWKMKNLVAKAVGTNVKEADPVWPFHELKLDKTGAWIYSGRCATRIFPRFCLVNPLQILNNTVNITCVMVCVNSV
jgi:hypothetical protein